MFKKLFKARTADFEPTNVMAQAQGSDLNVNRSFLSEIPQPEVVELTSESSWAAFNAEPENPVEAFEPTLPPEFQPTDFSVTQPTEGETPAAGTAKQSFDSGYMDILNEIDVDQVQRKRNSGSI